MVEGGGGGSSSEERKWYFNTLLHSAREYRSHKAMGGQSKTHLTAQTTERLAPLPCSPLLSPHLSAPTATSLLVYSICLLPLPSCIV